MSGSANFFCRGLNNKYFKLREPVSLLNSALIAQKQPYMIQKQMSVAVFQSNFTFKNKQWAGFGPLAIVC